MKFLKAISLALLVLALGACARPPQAEIDAALAAVDAAATDPDIVAYAPDTLKSAQDTLARMDTELAAKRYNEVKTLALSATATADAAANEAAQNKVKTQADATSLIAALKTALPNADKKGAAAKKFRGIKLDFAAIAKQLADANAGVADADMDLAAGSFALALQKATAAQAQLDDSEKLIALAIAGAPPAPAPPQWHPWSFSDYKRAMEESGRKIDSLDEKAFLAAQERKLRVFDDIGAMLERSFGSADPAIMKAFLEVPREYFMYNYEAGQNLGLSAYEQLPARQWKIGYGSVLTDFIMQAYMTAKSKPKPTDVTLEVGTGSGYQSSLLSRIVKRAYTIEIITLLGDKVKSIFAPLGYDNIESRVGDGFFGWPEVEGGFDIILVTAQAPFVPPALLSQLKKGGRMIIPIGQPWKPQFLYLFTKDAQGKVHSQRDVSTLFIPMTGEIQTPPPKPTN